MEFNFKSDRKVTIWHRSHYTVEAATKEEAIELMKKEFEDAEYPEDGVVNFSNGEFLFDTEEVLEPEDNGGQFTRELILCSFPDTDETVLTNDTK